jgi:hypothetical protein
MKSTHHYQSEAHMRSNNPYEANYIVNTATYIDGVYMSEMHDKILTWNVNVEARDQ